MKHHESRERAAWVVTALIAFGVGVLLGGRACAPEPVVVEKVVVERERVEVCRDDCPDAAFVVEPAVRAAARQAPMTTREPLPEANTRASPAQRRKLLDWVQEQSRGDLDDCRRGLADVVRITVTVKFDEGQTRSARVNADENDVPDGVSSCVEERITAWEFPEVLIEGQSEVLFGLRL